MIRPVGDPEPSPIPVGERIAAVVSTTAAGVVALDLWGAGDALLVVALVAAAWVVRWDRAREREWDLIDGRRRVAQLLSERGAR